MDRRIINPWTWQDQYGFVQANEVTSPTRMLVSSGQTAFDAQGNAVHAGDMGKQITLALDNLEAVLKQAGFTLADVMRLTIYTTNVDACLREYAALTKRLTAANCRAAQTLLGVARLATKELMVEIEATAMK